MLTFAIGKVKNQGPDLIIKEFLIGLEPERCLFSLLK